MQYVQHALRVSERQLREQEAPYGELDATAMGCDPAMTEEEVWLQAFFGDDPRWELGDGKFVLSTSEVEIELEEVRNGHPEP